MLLILKFNGFSNSTYLDSVSNPLLNVINQQLLTVLVYQFLNYNSSFVYFHFIP